MDLKIIDSHVHFDVKGIPVVLIRERYIKEHGKAKWEKIRRKNQYQVERWMNAWRFPQPEDPDEDVEVTAKKWLAEMNENQIDKIVLITGGGNELLSKIVKLSPQHFIGYAHHDLFEQDASQQLEHAITFLGLKGYKTIAPDLSGRIDDDSLKPFWRVAEKHEIPVLIHFGPAGGAGGIANHCNINPLILHDVARAYPDIPFIIPHFGCGYPQELLQLAWVCPNIHVDTSGSNQWIRWMPYPLTVRDLFRKYYETIGPERIIFGTDSQWFPRGFVTRYFEDQLRDCIDLGMKTDEIQLIFGGNIARLLKLEE